MLSDTRVEQLESIRFKWKVSPSNDSSDTGDSKIETAKSLTECQREREGASSGISNTSMSLGLR